MEIECGGSRAYSTHDWRRMNRVGQDRIAGWCSRDLILCVSAM